MKGHASKSPHLTSGPSYSRGRRIRPIEPRACSGLLSAGVSVLNYPSGRVGMNTPSPDGWEGSENEPTIYYRKEVFFWEALASMEDICFLP